VIYTEWQPRFSLASTVVTAVLVAYLLGVMPWRSRRQYRRLRAKRATDPGALSRSYLLSIVVWVGLAAIACLLPIVSPGPRYSDLGLAWPAGVPGWYIWVFGAAFVLSGAASGAFRRRRWSRTDRLPPLLRAAAALLPVTPRERRLAVVRCVTAGVCEEIVYRGLFIAAGVGIFGLSWWLSAVLAAIAFGMAHLYQGAAGVVGTTVVGLVLTGLYLSTGSLLLAIIAHTAVDLVATLSPPPALVARELAGQAGGG
jgi:membrane protease YdiL (CAAX protease family)